jgi:phosphate-selective porin
VHSRLSSSLVFAALLLSLPAAAQEPGDPPSPPWSSGYHNGSFYVRSPDDIFRLYVQGRVHVDYYDAFASNLGSLAPGVGPNQGFELRRARLELAGEFFQTWQWQVGAEFAPSADNNVAANTASLACKVNGKTSFETCSPQLNAVDAATVAPAPTDAFINYAASPWVNVQVGQYYLPFTMENRIIDNTTAFLERALVVRSIGAPLQRDIGAMAWGESPDRLFYYAAGVFNGDGPNRPNVDTRYDFAGRVVARPFARATSTPAKWAELGVSLHEGSRDPSRVGYDMPALTTAEGFAFWKPTYTDSFGRLTHVLPSGAQQAFGADLYLPIGNFDVTGEFVYASYHTREAVDGMQISPFTERLGSLEGWGLYAQVGYWIIGDHDIIGYPSYGRPIHVDLAQPQQPARHGLQVVARVDELALKYEGASRGGALNPKTPDGDVDVTSFMLGVNYWATRHLRVGVNYGYYALPATAAITSLHEVSARVGVQF